MREVLISKRFLTSSAIFVLLLVAFLAMVYPVRCIPWNVMISGPNEGWNAYFQQAAIKGGALYPDRSQLITNNYPPFSFYAVGLVGRVLGDSILAGRWIAFFSLLFIALFIFKIIRELGGERSSGIVGASFFIATMGLFFERYVAMNDPQLLAQAIMSGAFFLFLKAVKQRKECFFPIAMMVFAGFFKQNIIMFPVSALLWLLVRKEQSNFWKCLAYSIVLISGGFVLCYVCYGSAFFFNFLAPRRFFSAQEIAALLDLQCVFLAAVISFPILWKYRCESHVVLILILLAVGLGAHFLQRIGSGVDSNSQFCFNIAMALAVGMTFHLLALFSVKEFLQTLFVILLLV
ncbi:MAG: glycosyltransferase family 39 protein, partial [Verrucomicrobiota bacterium]